MQVVTAAAPTTLQYLRLSMPAELPACLGGLASLTALSIQPRRPSRLAFPAELSRLSRLHTLCVEPEADYVEPGLESVLEELQVLPALSGLQCLDLGDAWFESLDCVQVSKGRPIACAYTCSQLYKVPDFT